MLPGARDSGVPIIEGTTALISISYGTCGEMVITHEVIGISKIPPPVVIVEYPTIVGLDKYS